MWDGIVVESSVIDRSSVRSPISECMQNSNIIVFVFVTNLLRISGDKHRFFNGWNRKVIPLGLRGFQYTYSTVVRSLRIAIWVQLY